MSSGSNIRVHQDFKVDGLWVKNFTLESKSVFTKSASIWYNMRKRCNNVMKVKNPAYQDVTCSDNFKNFQYFAEWCNNQKGYHNHGWELDKDMLVPDNRIYSEDTCLFVPQQMNALLVKRREKKSPLPLGVFMEPKSGAIFAVVQNKGIREYLGCFKTIELASQAYLQRKSDICLDYINQLNDIDVDERLISSLHNISTNYLKQKEEINGR